VAELDQVALGALRRSNRAKLGVLGHDRRQRRSNSRALRPVNDYAAVLAADPVAFAGYHRWDLYYNTTAGDVVLPIGYCATAPIRVADYLTTHPQFGDK
jgi:hypothetical protein